MRVTDERIKPWIGLLKHGGYYNHESMRELCRDLLADREEMQGEIEQLKDGLTAAYLTGVHRGGDLAKGSKP